MTFATYRDSRRRLGEKAKSRRRFSLPQIRRRGVARLPRYDSAPPASLEKHGDFNARVTSAEATRRDATRRESREAVIVVPRRFARIFVKVKDRPRGELELNARARQECAAGKSRLAH